MSNQNWNYRKAIVIVAHPDDEILWTGGTILMHPATEWTIISLCRGTDPNRAPRFRRVLECLNTKGEVFNLDDDSEQILLPDRKVDNDVLRLIPSWKPDLVITHSPEGELQ